MSDDALDLMPIVERWAPLTGRTWRCEPHGKRAKSATLTAGNDVVARVWGRIERDQEDRVPRAFGAAVDDVVALVIEVRRLRALVNELRADIGA
jgi:hypothetical protein